MLLFYSWGFHNVVVVVVLPDLLVAYHLHCCLLCCLVVLLLAGLGWWFVGCFPGVGLVLAEIELGF